MTETVLRHPSTSSSKQFENGVRYGGFKPKNPVEYERRILVAEQFIPPDFIWYYERFPMDVSIFAILFGSLDMHAESIDDIQQNGQFENIELWLEWVEKHFSDIEEVYRFAADMWPYVLKILKHAQRNAAYAEFEDILTHKRRTSSVPPLLDAAQDAPLQDEVDIVCWAEKFPDDESEALEEIIDPLHMLTIPFPTAYRIAERKEHERAAEEEARRVARQAEQAKRLREKERRLRDLDRLAQGREARMELTKALTAADQISESPRSGASTFRFDPTKGLRKSSSMGSLIDSETSRSTGVTPREIVPALVTFNQFRRRASADSSAQEVNKEVSSNSANSSTVPPNNTQREEELIRLNSIPEAENSKTNLSRQNSLSLIISGSSVDTGNQAAKSHRNMDSASAKQVVEENPTTNARRECNTSPTLARQSPTAKGNVSKVVAGAVFNASMFQGKYAFDSSPTCFNSERFSLNGRMIDSDFPISNKPRKLDPMDHPYPISLNKVIMTAKYNRAQSGRSRSVPRLFSGRANSGRYDQPMDPIHNDQFSSRQDRFSARHHSHVRDSQSARQLSPGRSINSARQHSPESHAAISRLHKQERKTNSARYVRSFPDGGRSDDAVRLSQERKASSARNYPKLDPLSRKYSQLGAPTHPKFAHLKTSRSASWSHKADAREDEGNTAIMGGEVDAEATNQGTAGYGSGGAQSGAPPGLGPIKTARSFDPKRFQVSRSYSDPSLCESGLSSAVKPSPTSARSGADNLEQQFIADSMKTHRRLSIELQLERSHSGMQGPSRHASGSFPSSSPTMGSSPSGPAVLAPLRTLPRQPWQSGKSISVPNSPVAYMPSPPEPSGSSRLGQKVTLARQVHQAFRSSLSNLAQDIEHRRMINSLLHTPEDSPKHASAQGSNLVESDKETVPETGWGKVRLIQKHLSSVQAFQDVVLQEKSGSSERVEWEGGVQSPSPTLRNNLSVETRRKGSLIAQNFYTGINRVGHVGLEGQYSKLVVKNVDVEALLKKIQISSEPQLIATTLLGYRFDVIAAVVSTLATATKPRSKSPFVEESSTGGMQRMAEILRLARMPAVCAAKILRDVSDEAVAAGLLRELPGEDRTALEAVRERLPSLTSKATQIYAALQGMPLSTVVPTLGSAGVDSAVAAEVLSMVEDRNMAHGMLLLLLTEFPDRTALICTHANPHLIGSHINEAMDEGGSPEATLDLPGVVSSVERLLERLAPQRAANILEQLMPRPRAQFLESLCKDTVVRILQTMGPVKVAEAFCEIKELAKCGNWMSAVEEEIALPFFLAMQSNPPGFAAAHILASMPDIQAGTLLMGIPSEKRRPILEESPVSFLVTVLEKVSRDQALGLVEEMNQPTAALVMENLPAGVAARIWEGLPLSKLTAVICLMSVENAAAETLQLMLPGKAAGVIDHLPRKIATRLLGLMKPGKAATILSNLVNATVTELMSLMESAAVAEVMQSVHGDNFLPVLRQIQPAVASRIINCMTAVKAAGVLTKIYQCSTVVRGQSQASALGIFQGVSIQQGVEVANTPAMEVSVMAGLISTISGENAAAMLVNVEVLKATHILEHVSEESVPLIATHFPADRLVECVGHMKNVKTAAKALERLEPQQCLPVLSSLKDSKKLHSTGVSKYDAIVQEMQPMSVAIMFSKVETDTVVEMCLEIEARQVGLILSKMTSQQGTNVLSQMQKNGNGLKHAAGSVTHMHPSSASKTIEGMEETKALKLMGQVGAKTGAKMFHHMNGKTTEQLLIGLPPTVGGGMLGELALIDPNMASGILSKLEKCPKGVGKEVFRHMDDGGVAALLSACSPSAAAVFLTKFSTECLASGISQLRPVVIANLLKSITPQESWEILKHIPNICKGLTKRLGFEYFSEMTRHMDVDLGAKIFKEMDSQDACDVVENLGGEQAAFLFEKMADHNMHRIVLLMDVQKAGELLSWIAPEKAVTLFHHMDAETASNYLNGIAREPASKLLTYVLSEKAAAMISFFDVERGASFFISMNTGAKDAILNNMETELKQSYLKHFQLNGRK